MIPKKEKRIIFHILLHYIKCLRDPFFSTMGFLPERNWYRAESRNLSGWNKKTTFAATPHRPPSLRSHHTQWPMFLFCWEDISWQTVAPSHIVPKIKINIFHFLKYKYIFFLLVLCVMCQSSISPKQNKKNEKFISRYFCWNFIYLCNQS